MQLIIGFLLSNMPAFTIMAELHQSQMDRLSRSNEILIILCQPSHEIYTQQ